MTTANQNQEKFQNLLRELFQFDCADLDFGIYRIMNHKREVIEKFISEDLVKAVSEELARGILHDQDMAVIELQETAKLVRETSSPNAATPGNNVMPFPITVKRYTCTGPIRTSTTLKPRSTFTTIPGARMASQYISKSRPLM